MDTEPRRASVYVKAGEILVDPMRNTVEFIDDGPTVIQWAELLNLLKKTAESIENVLHDGTDKEGYEVLLTGGIILEAGTHDINTVAECFHIMANDATPSHIALHVIPDLKKE